MSALGAGQGVQQDNEPVISGRGIWLCLADSYPRGKNSTQRKPRLKVDGFFKYSTTSSRLLCEGLFLSFQSPISVL
jgi:hypothetical protein